MGLTLCDGINDFLKEATNVSFENKKILMLGKQIIYIDSVQMFILANRMGIKLTTGDFIKEDKHNHIDAYSFFQCLGFLEVHAMDISDYEEADIIFDLNCANLPKNLNNQFDYIVDGGTLEHVFNVPNALENITKMLKVGGKVFHYLPASDYINHGFYSFSPSLLNSFYEENGFVIKESQIILGSSDFYNNMIENVFPKKLEDCLSTCLDYRLLDLMDGRFDLLKGYKGTLRCIAQKKEDFIANKVPVQRHWYQNKKDVFRLIIERYKLCSYPEGSIAIWGNGVTAKEFLEAFKSSELFDTKIIKGFFNGKDVSLIGNKYEGYTVFGYKKEEVCGLKVIVIAAVDYEEQIYEQVKCLENENIKIIKLKKYCM